MLLTLSLTDRHLLAAGTNQPAPATPEPSTEWIDPDTGHRVIRLSQEPGTASLYFHQYAYTAGGKKLVVTTRDRGIATINLETRAVERLVAGPVNVLVAGRKTGDVYYTKRTSREVTRADGTRETVIEAVVYAAEVATGRTREIAKLPSGRFVASLNADETLLLGSYVEGANQSAWGGGRREPRPDGRLPDTDLRFQQPNYEALGPDGNPLVYAEAKERRLHEALAGIRAGPPHVIFTLNLRTGELKDVYQEREWLNHLQFSPTDPGLIMFCHEGPWHEVDRIWTIRADGTSLTKIHTRTMAMEIAGHEFFSADGNTIWYDLQTPRGEDFWVAGPEIATGRRTWYHLQRDEWSVHFNVSPDGKLFAGDGGDSEMVAHAKNAKWIYLFRPEQTPDLAGISSPNPTSMIEPGILRAERLVNMSQHDYRLEPNVTFSPDMKWIIFRSNMHGAVQVYAVEIAKAKSHPPAAREAFGRGEPPS
jgi:oligogalacturonide lyase